MGLPRFVHLHVHSQFSFLDGGSFIEKIVSQAAEADMVALALTDHDSVSGAVKFARTCRKMGIKPIQGAEVTVSATKWVMQSTGRPPETDIRSGAQISGDHHLTLLARNAKGYANLCGLLTGAHLESPRGRPRCTWKDLEEHGEGLVALSGCRRGEISSLILRKRYNEAKEAALRCLSLWGRRFYLELQDLLLPGDRFLNERLVELGETLGIPVVATNNVHYARRDGFPAHDLLTCVRLGISIEKVHGERPLNDEQYLKDSSEMRGLFSRCPESLRNSVEISGMCEPALELKELNTVRIPKFPLPEGWSSADEFLRKLVYEGARERYGRLYSTVQERLERELFVIHRLGYADYFLVAHDVVRYARSRGIRCAGRGSAGASVVAYCLHLTEVDPVKRNLIFERFLSLERAEKPDIDIDFDSRYRDEVTRYVYGKYGEDRVAAVATYSTYKARSAVRDIGKVLGYPQEEIDSLSKSMPPVPADGIFEALDRFPELRRGPWREKRYRPLFDFCTRIAGFPRFLGTHLGGLVITGRPITEVTPLQLSAKGIQIVQFDRDDAEELGLFKLDLLSLKAMSVLDEAAREISILNPAFDYKDLPLDDRETYNLINRGETIGVFQLESPAQRALQTRLGAEDIEDVVASLALIRPGPIKGNMVGPFVVRRSGKEPVTYLHPRLVPILEKTYGVVLFQEQVIAIATELAGFEPGEADRLRRLMTHARSLREMRSIGEEFVCRATERGVDEKAARSIFACLEGYASYGFCEAHAAAFATTSYWTAYLSAHYPAQFYAALLNAQPVGYYPVSTLANEARRRGIKLLRPDINASGEKFTVEESAIRIPLSSVKDMSRRALSEIIRERSKGTFRSFPDFLRRTGIDGDIVKNLVLCGAFDSLYPNRRALLVWSTQLVPPNDSRVKSLRMLDLDPPSALRDFSPSEKSLMEYELLGMEVDRHLMSFLREELERQGFVTSRRTRLLPDGVEVKAAGIPIRPHRPPTRSGRIVAFFSLEDETGLLDVTVFEDVYQKFGHLLFGPALVPLKVAGTLMRRGRGVSLTARTLEPIRHGQYGGSPQ